MLYEGWVSVLVRDDFLCCPQFYTVWTYREWRSHDPRLQLKMVCSVFYSRSWFSLQRPGRPPHQCFCYFFFFWTITDDLKKECPLYLNVYLKPRCDVPVSPTVPFTLHGVPLKPHHPKEVHSTFPRFYGLLCQTTVPWPSLGCSLACIYSQGGVLLISTLRKIQKSFLDCKDQVRRKGIVWP